MSLYIMCGFWGEGDSTTSILILGDNHAHYLSLLVLLSLLWTCKCGFSIYTLYTKFGAWCTKTLLCMFLLLLALSVFVPGISNQCFLHFSTSMFNIVALSLCFGTLMTAQQKYTGAQVNSCMSVSYTHLTLPTKRIV